MIPNLLSILVWLPLPGLLAVVLLPKERTPVYRLITLIITSVQLVLAIILFLSFDQQKGPSFESNLQFVEKLNWIHLDLGGLGHLDIQYFLAVDGLNVLMVLLSAIVMFLGTLASWNIQHKTQGYFALYLLLTISITGCFVALDLFLFYIFFEFMLLPMFFLIGIWGGKRREYASIKFFLYTLVGSILILIVMIGLYTSTIDPVKTGDLANIDNLEEVQQRLINGQIELGNQVHTFSIPMMMDVNNSTPDSIFSLEFDGFIMGLDPRLLAFLALLIGFAIKLPAVPVHTWLPDAHVEAPTPISVVLAGILLKVGGYGLIRIGYAIFPDGAVHFSFLIGLVGVISIVYGGMNAMAQKDLKKLIAYSSVSHMGFVLLGFSSMTVEGFNGAIFQMFSHGIISSMLFIIVGVLYDRTHDRLIENYSGLVSKMPKYTFFVVIGFFASLGLPGFSGFVGEILVFLGGFRSESVNGLIPNWLVVLGTFGLLISAAYYLWTMQRMFFGKFWVKDSALEESITDINGVEWVMLSVCALLALFFGILPGTLLDTTGSAVGGFVDLVLKNGQRILQLKLH